MTENKYFRVIRQAKPGKNWANNTNGQFIDIDGDYRYRFASEDKGYFWYGYKLCDLRAHYYDLKEEEQPIAIIRKLPVVAWGLLPQYIRWEAEKSLRDIFSVYYGQCFEAWKSNKRFDIELMAKSEKEIEAAYIEAMIADESYRIEESSKRLFPYLYDEERLILKQVGDSFIRYLRDRLNELKPNHNQSPSVHQLPDQLNTDEARRYFRKAIDLGLMSEGYKWLKGLQMLACFARDMSLKLNLNKATNSDGTKRISWKPFENLFEVEQGKLRLNYNDIQKTGQNPSEISLIDKVFE